MVLEDFLENRFYFHSAHVGLKKKTKTKSDVKSRKKLFVHLVLQFL